VEQERRPLFFFFSCHISWSVSWSLQRNGAAVKGRHEGGGLGGEELLKPQSGADMAGAAIGVVVLFLAAAPFGANANTDSNDGE